MSSIVIKVVYKETCHLLYRKGSAAIRVAALTNLRAMGLNQKTSNSLRQSAVLHLAAVGDADPISKTTAKNNITMPRKRKTCMG